MTQYSKGGRGKKAPYQTIHYRIPQPIKPVVESLAEHYRELVAAESTAEAEEMLERVQSNIVGSVSDENKPGTKFNEADLGQVISVLQEALTLKANAGGKIKDRIREALKLLEKSVD
jgi:hypothetical protein